MGEELLEPVGCSLSANEVVCLPCTLSFNVVPACRKEGSSRTVRSEQAESGAGAACKGSIPWRQGEAIHHGRELLLQEACTHFYSSYAYYKDINST